MIETKFFHINYYVNYYEYFKAIKIFSSKKALTKNKPIKVKMSDKVEMNFLSYYFGNLVKQIYYFFVKTMSLFISKEYASQMKKTSSAHKAFSQLKEPLKKLNI